MPCVCVLIAYLGLSTIWDGSPRTLTFEIEGWSNQSWGLHDIERRRIRCEVAVAGDGSRMNQCGFEYFHHYFIRYSEGQIRSLYSRSDHSGFYIDDTNRTARGGRCNCTWTPMRAMPDDSECTRTAQVRLPNSKLTGTGQIAGHGTVQYSLIDTEGKQTDLSFAPALACEVMEEIVTFPGTLIIPGAKSRYRVTSYKTGEPDRSRFRVPSGYKIKPERE
jgi:hypothetical protein